MDTIPLVFCFIGVGAALIGFLRVAHCLFEGEPPTRETTVRLKKAREPYMVLMLPAFLVGSISSAFLPQEQGIWLFLIFVLMFTCFYGFALRDIWKAVRST